MTREIPILFSAPMIRAILSGQKTQTRRILKDAPTGPGWHCDRTATGLRWVASAGAPSMPVRLRWSVGDVLWVRETVRADECWDEDSIGVRYLADDLYRPLPDTDEAKERHFVLRCYRSTDPDLDAYKKVPAIHMPRWASRITLDVVGVRVERLQDINNADALAEGTLEATEVPYIGSMTSEMARHAYALLWDHINGAGSWGANPWVVAIEFRRVPDAP